MSTKRKILLCIFVITVTSTSLIFASDISSLIRDLGDRNKEKAKEASDKLARIGKPAVGHLIVASISNNTHRKRYGARALRGIGQDAVDAIPALSKLLKDRDTRTREYAVEALGNMVLQAPQVLPILEKAKKDSSKDVAKKAKLAIERIKAVLTDGEKLAEIVKYRLNNVGKKCTSLVLEEESPNQYKGVAEFEDGLKSQVVVKILGSKIQYSLGDELKTDVKKTDGSSSESASKEAREAKSNESKKAISQENEIILLRSKIKELEDTVRSQRQIIERLNGELAESRKKLEDIAKNVQIVRVDDSTEKTKKSLVDSNPLVAGVMNSTLPGYDLTTIGRAFNNFFTNNKWELKVAENGAKFVEFSGRLKDELDIKGPWASWNKRDMVIFKFVISHDSTSFELWCIELPPRKTSWGQARRVNLRRSDDWEKREAMEDLLNKIYAIQ